MLLNYHFILIMSMKIFFAWIIIDNFRTRTYTNVIVFALILIVVDKIDEF